MFLPYKITTVPARPSVVNGGLLLIIVAIYVLNIYAGETLRKVEELPLLAELVNNVYHEHWVHLLGNLVYIYFFGNLVSRLLGYKVYILAVALAIATAYAIDLALEEVSFGASGIASGLMGVALATHPLLKFKALYILGYANGLVRLSVVWVVLFAILLDTSGMLGYATGSVYYDNVAYWVHLACLSMGFIFGYVGIRDRLIIKKDDQSTALNIMATPALLPIRLARDETNAPVVNGWAIFIVITQALGFWAIYHYSQDMVQGENTRMNFYIIGAYALTNIACATLVLLNVKSAYKIILGAFAINTVLALAFGWTITSRIENLLILLLLFQSEVHRVFWPRFGRKHARAAEAAETHG